MTRGPRIITAETRAEMQKILDEIRSGAFAKEWILENQVGRPVFNALRRKSHEQPIGTRSQSDRYIVVVESHPPMFAPWR